MPNILDTSYTFEVGGVIYEFTTTTACFEGPLNTFETSLLVPYDQGGTSLYYMELLRNRLIVAANTESHPTRSIRRIFLLAFHGDLHSVLRDLVPTPTTQEKGVKLCGKRTILQIDADLRSKPGLLQGALSELKNLGITMPHYQLLRRYLATDEPNVLVPLACVMVCLAKALEVNALS